MLDFPLFLLLGKINPAQVLILFGLMLLCFLILNDHFMLPLFPCHQSRLNYLRSRGEAEDYG
jgi:hypothetical protein